MKARGIVAVWLAALAVTAPSALAQMPDVRQMSGIPMPAGDVPTGTVIVRVVRTNIAENMVGQAVELQVGDKIQTATTDSNGHAQFAGLPFGANARVSTVIDGRRVESQPFAVPASGGFRLILAAGGDSAAPAAPAPGQIAAVAGDVIFGGDSRIQIEFDDDALTVFYIFDIVNAGGAPVSPKADVAFDLPMGAQQPTLLEGSSSQATLRGRRVSIAGPFAPGSTPVQIAFGLAPGGSERVLSQVLPLAWGRVQVMVTKLPGVSMSSPEFATSSEVPGDTHAFLVGSGAGLTPGKELSVTLTGVPSRGKAGRYVAIALAVLVLLGGVWAIATAPTRTGDMARRAELDERRARLMADLVRLEAQQRAGTVDAARYATRRGDLIDQLERVYGELDQHASAPGDGPVA